MGEAFVTRFTDAGPEGSIVKDMGRKALMAGPVLVLAFGVYATIWLVVLVGSQFFGPR